MQSNRGSAKLTAIKIQNAKPAKDERGQFVRTEIPDAGKPGLFLIVQPSGNKSWAVRYRRQSDRKPRKLTLDGFPSLGVAHKLAQAALDRAAEGHDPAAEKRVTKQAAQPQSSDLVEAVFADFLARHVRTKSGKAVREVTRRETARILGFKRDPNSLETWIRTGGGVVARWQGRTIQSITKRDMLDLLDDIVETSPIAANRTLGALKVCLNWRVRRDSLTFPKSPADGVDSPAAESQRERVLSDAELAALWRAADGDFYPFGPLVKLLILTGCRRDEVRQAVWSEFDLPARTWTLPPARTKNGHPHLVPLCDKAVTILEAMPRIKGSGLLFTADGEKPISKNLTHRRRRLHAAMVKELKVEPERWTLHDIRRSFCTGLQRLGFSQEICEAAVNHKSGTLAGIARIYARHDFATEKRAALAAWARHVDSILSEKSADVISLVRGKRA